MVTAALWWEAGGMPVKRDAGKERGRQSGVCGRAHRHEGGSPVSVCPGAPGASRQGSAFFLNHPKRSTNISSHPGASGSYSCFTSAPLPSKSPPIFLRLGGQGIGSYRSRDAPATHAHTMLGQVPGTGPLGPCVRAGGSPAPSWGSPRALFQSVPKEPLLCAPTQPLLPVLKWPFGGRQGGGQAGGGWRRGGPGSSLSYLSGEPQPLSKS